MNIWSDNETYISVEIQCHFHVFDLWAEILSQLCYFNVGLPYCSPPEW